MSEGGSREFQRVQASFTVSYATIDQLVVAYTKDLSKGGMFLLTTQFLPVNAVVRVVLELPAGGGKLPVICRVAYIRRGESWADKPAGMGIEFLDLGVEGLLTLERLISSQDAEPPSTGKMLVAERKISMVVVDDEPLARMRVAVAFREQGHTVRTGQDGLEGLALCLKDPPDVLLSDVQMPRMDGWQLLRMVRARASLSHVVVIFLTTLGGDDDRLQGYKLGVDDYIAKNATDVELKSRVSRAVSRGQQSRRSLVERKTLRGDLEQVGLPSVLSFLEMERKTGVLFVLAERTGRVFVREGRPVGVDVEGAPKEQLARELFFELLSWKEGQFEFALQDVSNEDEVNASSGELLLEHARRSDEAKR